ncbi:MAG: CRISPR-associated protein [Prevotellaceae bacterium]|jgi:hypothetical protein|nr:CRISPR-associated protein [Prevotellaceae bacterium]
MLINLSNHPSALWQPAQIEAAAVYGEILDMAFPVINPDWDVNQVKELAENYFRQCKQSLLNAGGDSAVHLVGEPVFCFLLAQLLLKKHILCITSTSERIVSEEGGKKISEFRFKRFREYKLITDKP